MDRIIVAGNIGVDEIWHLDRALRPGRRLRCLERVQRVGGGAANTAAALLALRRTPLVAATLREDALGNALLARLTQASLDTTLIERTPGTTRPGIILLEPNGERTLIGGLRSRSKVPRAIPAASPIVYLNFASLEHPAALATLQNRRWLVAQLPLDLDEPRPAHLLIASRSDVDDIPLAELWRQRRAIDGTVLRAIVLTNGPDGAAFISEAGEGWLPCPARLQADSIGAGDFFAAGLLAGLSDDNDLPVSIHLGQQTAQTCLLNRPAILRAFDTQAG